MGRAARDSSFDAFQRKVIASELSSEDLSVRFETLDQQLLTFGWKDRLSIDSEPMALATSKHLENSYCSVDFEAENMDIRYGKQVLRLKLAE